MIELSIIVPIYRIKESLLKACIESLCNQYSKEIEIILIDDGSPDSCGMICDEYSMRYGNIIVKHTSNNGVSCARNEGIKIATGRYLMFVDGDDYLEENVCEECIKAIQSYSADLFMFKFFDKHISESRKDIIVKDKRQIKNFQLSVLSHIELYSGYISGSPCAKLYKREIIKYNGLRFVEKLKKCQDRVFNFDFFNYVNSIVLLDFKGYHYIVNQESVTNKYNPAIISILDKAIHEFELRLNKNDLNQQRAFSLLCLRFLGEVFHLDILNSNNTETFRERARRIKNIVNFEYYRKALKVHNIFSCGKKNLIIFLLIKCHLIYLAVITGYHLYK